MIHVHFIYGILMNKSFDRYYFYDLYGILMNEIFSINISMICNYNFQ